MSDNHLKLRRRDGTLLPGQGALNPGGRPVGIEKRMRELIDQQGEPWNGRTLDGWEAMTMMMYEVAMGRTPPGMAEADIKMRDRQEATKFLFDRVHGKPMVRVESDTTSHIGGMADLNVDGLTVDELNALEAHVELLAAKAAGFATDHVIDVDEDE